MNKNIHDRTESAHKLINENSRNKTLLIIILIAVSLLVAMWIWKNIQVKNEREESKQAMKVVKERATASLLETHKDHLGLLAKPYVWAIRNEMLSGNINQVHVYANEMVKEKNFQSIVVANDKGLIISSTNKKNEGKQFSSKSNQELLSGNSTLVQNLNDSILVMSSPVMGFNNRLGTLIITYKVDKPVF
jgi:sensor histidine kinase regulating citrate/malate metabolism